MNKEEKYILNLQSNKKIKKLINLLEDGEYKSRVLSARALGEIGGRDVIAPLRKATKDKVDIVAIEAIISLRKIITEPREIEELTFLQHKLEEEKQRSKEKQLINQVSNLSNKQLIEKHDSTSKEFDINLLRGEIERRGGISTLRRDIELEEQTMKLYYENKKRVCAFGGEKKRRCYDFDF